MSITYNWVFPFFEVAKSEDGLTDVVKSINWLYTATEDTYSAYFNGKVALGPPNPSDFIPYDQITEQWAIDAVSAVVDMPDMEIRLAAEIESQKNPPIVPLPPPFPQGEP